LVIGMELYNGSGPSADTIGAGIKFTDKCSDGSVYEPDGELEYIFRCDIVSVADIDECGFLDNAL
jgi:hypothetical protein